MDSEGPGNFDLPAYFPSPAPKLVLSRPGTQQYPPTSHSSNLNYNALPGPEVYGYYPISITINMPNKVVPALFPPISFTLKLSIHNLFTHHHHFLNQQFCTALIPCRPNHCTDMQIAPTLLKPIDCSLYIYPLPRDLHPPLPFCIKCLLSGCQATSHIYLHLNLSPVWRKTSMAISLLLSHLFSLMSFGWIIFYHVLWTNTLFSKSLCLTKLGTTFTIVLLRLLHISLSIIWRNGLTNWVGWLEYSQIEDPNIRGRGVPELKINKRKVQA